MATTGWKDALRRLCVRVVIDTGAVNGDDRLRARILRGGSG